MLIIFFSLHVACADHIVPAESDCRNDSRFLVHSLFPRVLSDGFFFYDFSFFKKSVHYRSLDDAFPVVTLHFEKELRLRVYPHDYLFSYKVIIFFFRSSIFVQFEYIQHYFPWQKNIQCFGWQNSGVQSKDAKDMFLLGGM